MNTRHDDLHQRGGARMADMDRRASVIARDNARAARWFVVWFILCALLGIASLVFIAWIVIVLLRFIGAV